MPLTYTFAFPFPRTSVAPLEHGQVPVAKAGCIFGIGTL
jgi:hypothetical protein